MPRIYTGTNEAVDFCNLCFPSEKQARKRYIDRSNMPRLAEQNFAYDAAHPYYPCDSYFCCICKAKLEDKDC